jgi:serine/threonine-protein kinase RsbW
MNPDALSWHFPAQADQVGGARQAVVAYAREHGALDPDGIALAVSEAMSNAVLHAFVGATRAGTVEVTVQRVRGNGLEVVVADDGRGLEPRSDSPGLGLGLPLMTAISQRLEFETRTGGGTSVRMHFAVC